MPNGNWAGDWRVYLHLPAHNISAGSPPDDIEPALQAALATGAVGAVELPLAGLGDEEAARLVDRFRQVVQRADVPLIGHGSAPRDVLKRLDGARVDEVDAMDKARGLFGTGGLVGVTLGGNRDTAMSAGEREPDFVYLNADADFVGWWAELMVVPCVAPGGDRLADAAAMLEEQPDFIALDAVAWNHPDGPAGAIRALAGMTAA